MKRLAVRPWFRLAPAAGAMLVALALASAVHARLAVPTCRTSQLHVWVTRTGAAASTVGGYIAFTSRASAPCTLRGWPTLTAVRPGAMSTAVHVRDTMFGPYVRVGGTWRYVRGVPLVRLRHGQTAVAAFTGGDNPGPGETTCPPSYAWFRVTPPGSVASATTKAWIAWLGQYMPSCTTMEVSMVVPASDLPPRG